MEVQLSNKWWDEIAHSSWMHKRILAILKQKFELIPPERQKDYQIRMVDKAGTTIYNKGYGDKWEYSHTFGSSRIVTGNIETCTYRGENSEKKHHYLQRIIS